MCQPCHARFYFGFQRRRRQQTTGRKRHPEAWDDMEKVDVGRKVWKCEEVNGVEENTPNSDFLDTSVIIKKLLLLLALERANET